ncbi:class I mannose-6-phosphate isomerase [Vibrio renipiscarius]|nr:class I mannose-6-phosphate isomerase [Vibrio renipiscarius]
MDYKGRVFSLSRNRVWRTYIGGESLNKLDGNNGIDDDHFPEDWIFSTTKANNKGREHIFEGISKTTINEHTLNLDELIEIDSDYFLGVEHVQQFGLNPMLLVKYLDSSIRLHFQAHPTIEFAKQHLDSKSGKAEAYYILSCDTPSPYIYLGFQRPPTPSDLKQLIETQNIPAIESCFDKVPVKPGDCYFIPGGMPHAIGENILMVEIMEPSDWAVRFEFEKAGYVLPEEARFMGRDLDFCLDVFNYNKVTSLDILNTYRSQPTLISHYNEESALYSLIGSDRTPCFRVNKSNIQGVVHKQEASFYIGIITQGSCSLICGDQRLELKQFDRFFCPAGVDSIQIIADQGVEILECLPPINPF